MTGSTISGTITNQTVTLGSASYASPLTITATGAIIEAGSGEIAIVGAGSQSGLGLLNAGTVSVTPLQDNYLPAAIEVANATITNTGYIFGIVSDGGGSLDNSGLLYSEVTDDPSVEDGFLTVTNSGTIRAVALGDFFSPPAVDLAKAGAVTNDGTILGNSAGFSGGSSGVVLQSGGLVTNDGFINSGGLDFGGVSAVVLVSGGTVANSGTIMGDGGITGYGSFRPSAGVFLANGGSILNTGGIIGNGTFGLGGTGIYMHGGTGTNLGMVAGGVSEYGELANGKGGAGLILTGSAIFMNQSIVTGAEGTGMFGAAGAGATVSAQATLLNIGSLTGGIGDASGYPLPAPIGPGTFRPTSTASTGGLGVSIGSIGLVINTGTIAGGAGGNGYYAGAGGTGAYVGTAGLLVNDAVVESGRAGGTTHSLDAGVSVGVTIAGGTVVNAGTIAGDPGQAGGVRQPGYGAAVDFAGAGTLVEDHGAVLLGSLAGFATGDVIILPSFTETGFSYVSGIGLELDTAGTVLTLDLTGSFSTSDFVVTQVTDATTITLHGTTAAPNPCFAAGTRILTPRGEVAVEALAVGDAVINHMGEDRVIVWIGWRDLDIGRHPKPETVRPIIIEAEALADGVPARWLVISPDHGLFIDNMLVQAKDLVNGSSIRPDAQARCVRYYHVELAAHDILFAEGAPAESYLDTGHRGVFDNAGAPLLLHPELMQMRREAEGCAPLCLGGDHLAAIRARIAQRLTGKGLRRLGPGGPRPQEIGPRVGYS